MVRAEVVHQTWLVRVVAMDQIWLVTAEALPRLEADTSDQKEQCS